MNLLWLDSDSKFKVSICPRAEGLAKGDWPCFVSLAYIHQVMLA